MVQQSKKRVFCFIAAALLAFVLGAAAAFSAAFQPAVPRVAAASSGARAAIESDDASVAAEYLKQENRGDYTYFDAPTALSATNEVLYVAEKGGKTNRFSISDSDKHVMKTETNYFESEAVKIAESGGNYLSLTASKKLVWYDVQSDSRIPVKNSDGADFECEDFTVTASGEVIAACGKDLFLISMGEPAKKVNSDERLPPAFGNFSEERNIRKIAALGDKLYAVFTSESNVSEDDVVCYERTEDAAERRYGNPKAAIASVSQVYDLTVLAAEKALVALTSGGLQRFEQKDFRLTEGAFFPATDLTNIAANGTQIFAMTQKKGVAAVDFTLTRRNVFLASSFSSTGFFDKPLGLTTRKGNLYVADELNNRIQILSNDTTTALTGVSRPKAVAVDYSGAVYVACNVNEIRILGKDDRTLTAPSESVNIIDLKIDEKDNLYALSDDGVLYRVSAGTKSFENICPSETVSAFALSPKTSVPYLYSKTDSEDKFILKRLNTATKTADECAYSDDNPANKKLEDLALTYTVKDFCLDNDESLYVLLSGLSGSHIVRYTQDDEQKLTLKIDAPTVFADEETSLSAGANRIVMNTVVQSKYAPTLHYGDLIVSDTARHAVKRIDGNQFSVNEFFKAENKPPVTDDPTPVQPDSRIIYELTANAEVYGRPAESECLSTLADGMRVIVPEYRQTETFTYVIADNITGGNDAETVSGYVYTALLSAPLDYTAQHPEYRYNWLITPIYKYPTRNAPAVKDYQALSQGTKLRILDFVYQTGANNKIDYGYKDNFISSIIWYRVAFGENEEYEGYVVGANTATSRPPIDEIQYPRNNAVIVAKDATNTGAAVYDRNEDGTFTALDEAQIAVGTKVEVVGSFDSSEPYTKIKYLVWVGDAQRPVERWVETVNLKYTGINTVQIVAIILIIVTVILVGLVIGRIFYTKRHRKLRDADKPRR